MGKLIALAVLFLYAAACWGTMPSQCFSAKFAVECQRVQVAAIADWRSVNWEYVHSVRRF